MSGGFKDGCPYFLILLPIASELSAFLFLILAMSLEIFLHTTAMTKVFLGGGRESTHKSHEVG